jgi:hypothetical protein
MPQLRFIVMLRPVPDVIRSFIPFFEAHDENFRRDWGGFPLAYSNRTQAIVDFLPGGVLSPMIFDFAKAWWQYRNRPNVLLLSYNAALRDTPATLRKIADFLHITLVGWSFSLHF